MHTETGSALARVIPFAIVLFILLVQIKKGKIPSAGLFINRPASTRHFLYWVIGFFILALLIEFILQAMGLLQFSQWNHPLLPSLILIAGAVLLAPMVEELIFRGLMIQVLTQRKLNLHLAILIQAVVFVLLHNFSYQNTLPSNIAVIQNLADAVLFGYAKQYTKSIYTPVAMHITGNCIATIERFML
jgi:membrane protease YdiL (CAAX protease family)